MDVTALTKNQVVKKQKGTRLSAGKDISGTPHHIMHSHSCLERILSIKLNIYVQSKGI
jgi:hypothetical protein